MIETASFGLLVGLTFVNAFMCIVNGWMFWCNSKVLTGLYNYINGV